VRTMSTRESPEEQDARLAFERETSAMGQAFANVCPPGYGFALLMFPLEGARLSLVSNVESEDAIAVMRAWVANAERTQIADAKAERGQA
jgi:hypothetical protein